MADTKPRTYTDSDGIVHVQSPQPKAFAWSSQAREAAAAAREAGAKHGGNYTTVGGDDGEMTHVFHNGMKMASLTKQTNGKFGGTVFHKGGATSGTSGHGTLADAVTRAIEKHAKNITTHDS